LRRLVEGREPQASEPSSKSPRRRRFSSDTINDLLFWAIQFCLVGFSLGIVWYRIDKNTQALKSLLDAQAEEVMLVRRQVTAVEQQTDLVKKQEEQRAVQLQENRRALDLMLTSMTEIQADVRRNLESTQGISETILQVANQTKQASLQAANASASAASAANSAANAAGNAASAASNAAARSSATKTLIREKVVTTEDKVRIDQEQRALAAKKAKLSKTIRQVSKNGPNLMQRIFQ
jgi:methyl-accepting chemotaxis protein